MANVTLLVSSSCQACPSAKSLWKQMRVKHSFSYREIDISSADGQELADLTRFPEIVPTFSSEQEALQASPVLAAV